MFKNCDYSANNNRCVNQRLELEITVSLARMYTHKYILAP